MMALAQPLALHQNLALRMQPVPVPPCSVPAGLQAGLGTQGHGCWHRCHMVPHHREAAVTSLCPVMAKAVHGKRCGCICPPVNPQQCRSPRLWCWLQGGENVILILLLPKAVGYLNGLKSQFPTDAAVCLTLPRCTHAHSAAKIWLLSSQSCRPGQVWQTQPGRPAGMLQQSTRICKGLELLQSLEPFSSRSMEPGMDKKLQSHVGLGCMGSTRGQGGGSTRGATRTVTCQRAVLPPAPKPCSNKACFLPGTPSARGARPT